LRPRRDGAGGVAGESAAGESVVVGPVVGSVVDSADGESLRDSAAGDPGGGVGLELGSDIDVSWPGTEGRRPTRL
jgi:hypothetical protein